MRKALFTLTLLSSALTLPQTAHADTIDDFVVSGDGHIITFSLPATFTAVDSTHLVSVNFTDITSSVDNVSGYSAFITTYVTPGFFRSGIDLALTPPVPGSVLSYQLNGANLTQFVSETQNIITFEFSPGMYSLSTFIAPMTPGGIPFTVTITPESASTPEPSTFTLLGTGLIGAIAAFRRRMSLH